MSATEALPSDPSSNSLEPLIIHFTSEPDIGELAPNAYHHWLGDNCADKKYSICIPPNFPHLLEASALLGELPVRIRPPTKGLSKKEASLECLRWQKYYPVKVLFELETPLTEMIHNLLVFSDTAYLKDFDCKGSNHYKVIYLSVEEAASIGGLLRESLIKVCALVILLQRGVYAIQASQGRDKDYLELVAAREKKMHKVVELEEERKKKEKEREEQKENLDLPESLDFGQVMAWARSMLSKFQEGNVSSNVNPIPCKTLNTSQEEKDLPGGVTIEACTSISSDTSGIQPHFTEATKRVPENKSPVTKADKYTQVTRNDLEEGRRVMTRDDWVLL